MIPEVFSTLNATRTVPLTVTATAVGRPTKTIEIVRAESELLAIDKLMAELTNEFVAEMKL